MMAIGRSWFTGIADSFWVRPVQIATAMEIDSAPSREQPESEILKPKRKLADGAVVEVGKRRCGYLSRILRPMRRMKPNTQQTSLVDETPILLYQRPTKAQRKRPCSLISEIPKGTRSLRYDPYSIPNRELYIPLLLRRPRYIFPRGEGKRSADEGFEQAPSKRLHKEQDNHPHDDHNRLLLQSSHYPNQGQERERTISPSSDYRSTSPGLFPNTSNMPIFISNTPSASHQPFRRRRRRSRIPRPVTFRLKSLNINCEEWDMDGLQTSSSCSDTSRSSTETDDPMDLETTDEKTSRPMSFFLRQIENLMSRPPRPCAQYPYSPWGPLSI